MNFLRSALYVFLLTLLFSIPKTVFCQTLMDSSETLVDPQTLIDTSSYTTTYTPEWIWVVSSSDGNDKYYMRSNYVSNRNNKIKIWIEDKSKVATINKIVYRNVLEKALMVFDCYNKKYNIVSIIKYSNTGKVIERNNYGEFSDFDDVVPDSVIEGVLEKVCEYYDK